MCCHFHLPNFKLYTAGQALKIQIAPKISEEFRLAVQAVNAFLNKQ